MTRRTDTGLMSGEWIMLFLVGASTALAIEVMRWWTLVLMAAIVLVYVGVVAARAYRDEFMADFRRNEEARQVATVSADLAGELEHALGIQLGDSGPVLIRCAVSGVRHEPGNEWAKDDLTFMGGLNWAANQTLFIIAADGLSAERIHTLWSFINDGIERQQPDR